MDKKPGIEKLKKIVDLNLLINQDNSLADLLHTMLTEIEQLFNVEGTVIFLEDNTSKKLLFYIASGENKYVLSTIYLQRCDGIRSFVFSSGESVLENDPLSLFCGMGDDNVSFTTRSILCIPLKIQNKNIGVIELVNKRKGNFVEADTEMLNIVGSLISLTIERARLIEEKMKSERLASIGDTIVGLSHYIKNILNGLRAGEFIINKNLKTGNSEKLIIGWDIIKSNINKVSLLVQDMLQYSKIGKPIYKLTDINELIQDVIDLLKAENKEKSIDIQFVKDSGIGEIAIDPIGIHRCVLNLVTNSIDAFKDGISNKIELRTKRNEGHVIVTIKDNGCGISEQDQEKMFSKYFSTKGSKGTGLGLPITKKIIEDHNGSLNFVSEVNSGTTFRILLPHRKWKRRKIMNTKVILVIDDENDTQEFIKSIIEDESVTIHSAYDGEEGLEKAKEILPDLIILDVQMPKKDGFATFREIKTYEKTTEIPIIMLTGIAEKRGVRFSKEEMKEYYGKEPAAYIEKPIDPEKLYNMIMDNLKD
jgi:signal transduction histidine kinase/CheY-like chemotaxis protein